MSITQHSSTESGGAPRSPGAAEPLAGLNPAQREAVLHYEGPLLVIAGAGSGKTRVLTTRIARLVDYHGVDPRQILAVTFTNKAAGEMRERIGRLLGREPAGMWVGTFHAIGARMLRSAAHLVGRTPNFTIYDEDDSLGVVKRIMEKHKLSPKERPPRAIYASISDAKNALVSPGEYEAIAKDPHAKAVALVYKDLEGVLRQANAVTFDDLLVLPVQVLRENPSVLHSYRERFRWLLVDEYQDTNAVQYQFVKLLGGEHGNVLVVGDDDQCLVRGTMVTMADGTRRPIEEVRVGDVVRSGAGSGTFRASRVTEVFARARRGLGIAITTAGGRRLVSTPEHTHFAGYVLGVVPQTYFVYLMKREGVGFRLGTSRVYTDGQVTPVVGFTQRLAQEHGDALWIVGTHQSESEARAAEYILSLRYQIPTLPFVPRKGKDGTAPPNGLVHDAAYLSRVFETFDTGSSAARLLADRGLSLDVPHHRPRSRNSSRRNVVLTLCGDRRGSRPMHRLMFIGSDASDRLALESLALSVRPAKAGSTSWRHETARADYADLQSSVERIGSRLPINVLRVARLGRATAESETASLPFTAASAVLPGMAMFDERGEFDVVVSVEHVPLDETVYDINVENTHNFIANGLLTHNSIYGWRGADIRNILDFEKDFPSARVVRLEENYRSTPEILDLANVAISANAERRGKTLRATRASGERPSAVATLDERDEADYVADEVLARRSSMQRPMLRDFAVLYRTNSQSRALEEAFRKRGVPYRLIGAVRFYDRREIRDLMAYLKLIANPADNEAFRRAVQVPKRGLGETTVEALAERADAAGVPLLEAASRADLVSGLRPAARTGLADFATLIRRLRERAADAAVDELLRELIDAIKYGDYLRAEGPESAERLDNVRELITGASETVSDEGGEVGLTPLDHFLQRATLVAGVDGLDPNADAVTMMTLHNAKGLEFPYVFMTGLEEGLFPLSKALYDGDPKLLEEERRLFYVGITRAEKKLFLTHAESRRRNGETLPSMPSSFLRDLPKEMLDFRKSIKVRSLGRTSFGDASGAGAGRGPASSWRSGGGSSAGSWGKTSSDWERGAKPSERRPGSPVRRDAAADPAEESQDAPLYVAGARVKHRMFGSGTIAELSGSGPSAKVRVDFDDESVGRKTLVVAQAKLERGDD